MTMSGRMLETLDGKWVGFVELPLFVQIVLLTWSAIVILGGSCFLWRMVRGLWSRGDSNRDQKSRRA